jgi:hypothetical protein
MVMLVCPSNHSNSSDQHRHGSEMHCLLHMSLMLGTTDLYNVLRLVWIVRYSHAYLVEALHLHARTGSTHTCYNTQQLLCSRRSCSSGTASRFTDVCACREAVMDKEAGSVQPLC